MQLENKREEGEHQSEEEDNEIVAMKAKFNQILANFGKEHVRELQR